MPLNSMGHKNTRVSKEKVEFFFWLIIVNLLERRKEGGREGRREAEVFKSLLCDLG